MLCFPASAQSQNILGIVTRQYSFITTPQILSIEVRAHYLGKKCSLGVSARVAEVEMELKIKEVKITPGTCLGFDPEKYFWNEKASQQRGLPFALYKSKSGYTIPAGLELILTPTPDPEDSNPLDTAAPILN